jgi:hypothetical protein
MVHVWIENNAGTMLAEAWAEVYPLEAGTYESLALPASAWSPAEADELHLKAECGGTAGYAVGTTAGFKGTWLSVIGKLAMPCV